MKRNWKIKDIPNLEGKVVIVTGGNKGLGYKSALELSKKGAEVIIACRNKELGEKAKAKILSEVTHATIDIMVLDLISKDSIKNFADTFMKHYKRLDILLNNAGVVSLENYRTNDDGIEMHMATNHLGHYMLTGYLMPLIKKTKDARIVTVTSGGYKFGEIDFEDFNWTNRDYDRVKAYSASKLANILFMKELQKRLTKAGIQAISLSSQPGLTATERQQSIGMGGSFSKMMASSVDTGCSPQLAAATEPSLKGSSLLGPKILLWGPPALQKITHYGTDDVLARKLWQYTENLTGVTYDFT